MWCVNVCVRCACGVCVNVYTVCVVCMWYVYMCAVHMHGYMLCMCAVCSCMRMVCVYVVYVWGMCAYTFMSMLSVHVFVYQLKGFFFIIGLP